MIIRRELPMIEAAMTVAPVVGGSVLIYSTTGVSLGFSNKLILRKPFSVCCCQSFSISSEV